MSKHGSNCCLCTKMNCLPNFTKCSEKVIWHQVVKKSGVFNFQKCRIPVNNKINTKFLRRLLSNFQYKDTLVCDLLEFGFPIGFEGDENSFCSKKSEQAIKNYKGANDFPEEIEKYLIKELSLDAIIGPFNENPFGSNIVISPLNSVPKKEPNERRVILDLSSGKESSINYFVDKDHYLNEEVCLIFPKVDDLVQLVLTKGRGCLMYKKDLSRAYRQIPICPSSYNLVAFKWKGHLFCDTVLSMGLRSAAHICQRVTNAIAFIMLSFGICLLNYLDDLAGAEIHENAEFAYKTLSYVLQKSGIQEASNKSSPPATVMTFLGVLFNSESMTLEITPERLIEIQALIKSWVVKENASVKEIQSLLGKLNFVGACVKPSRIFVNRLLNWYREFPKGNRQAQVPIPSEVKKDILWWDKFLPCYNGVSLMSLGSWGTPDEIFSSDACLQGCGGFWKGNFYHTEFPPEILEKNLHIGALEMLALVIGLRLWARYFRHLKIMIFCDNLSTCIAVNSGKTRCLFLQACLRELCFLAAVNEFEIKACHISGQDNRLADHLSRWNINQWHENEFRRLASDYSLKQWWVDQSCFEFLHAW